MTNWTVVSKNLRKYDLHSLHTLLRSAREEKQETMWREIRFQIDWLEEMAEHYAPQHTENAVRAIHEN